MITAYKLDNCENCNNELPVDGISCTVCQGHIGFPNVRLAKTEEDDLNQRFNSELESVKLRDLTSVISKFRDSVNDANVVMARKVIQLIPMIENDNSLLSTFHEQVASGARIAENNQYDPKRAAVESTVHPLYFEKIHYAALSLTDTGVEGPYGDVHLLLNTLHIKQRTTFFQENPFNLLKKLQLQCTERLPSGYRATWENKDKLSVCKCHSLLDKKHDNVVDFQNALMIQGENPEFLEANIYGSIHSKCIKKVTFFGVEVESKLLFNVYKKRIIDKDITVEIKD